MWLTPDDIDESTVVSEIGDVWSPNNPPLSAAPKQIGTEISRAIARGTTIGIINANVPHDEPVASERQAPTKKIMLASIQLGKFIALSNAAIVPPVSNATNTSLMVHARIRMQRIGIIFPMPLKKLVELLDKLKILNWLSAAIVTIVARV
jgi:hypothetical protein